MDFHDLKTLKTHAEAGLITVDEAKEKAAARFAGFLGEEKPADIVCGGFVLADGDNFECAALSMRLRNGGATMSAAPIPTSARWW